jgi:hypothetical protein
MFGATTNMLGVKLFFADILTLNCAQKIRLTEFPFLLPLGL